MRNLLANLILLLLAQCASASCGYIANPKFNDNLLILAQRRDGKYDSGSRGESLGEVRLSTLFGNAGAPFRKKTANIIVHNSKFSWASDYSLGLGAEDIVCNLKSGDGVLLPFAKRPHFSIVWNIDYKKKTILLFDEFPYASPLRLGDRDNLGRYRGQLIDLKKNNLHRVLIEVPIEDVENNIIATILMNRDKRWLNKLAPQLNSNNRNNLFAMSSIQCGYSCSAGGGGRDSKDPQGAESFAMYAQILESAMHSKIQVRINLPRKDDVKKWPENEAIFLAKTAIDVGQYELSEFVLKELSSKNKVVVLLSKVLLAYARMEMGGVAVIKESQDAISYAEKNIDSRCARKLELLDRGAFPDKVFYGEQSDECWLSLAAIRDARVIYIMGLVARKQADYKAIDKLTPVIKNSPSLAPLVSIAYANAGDFSTARSILKNLFFRNEGSASNRAIMYEKISLFEPGVINSLAFDGVAGIYIIQYYAVPGLLLDRITWQESRSKYPFFEWIGLNSKP